MKLSEVLLTPDNTSGEQRAAKLRKESLNALQEREKQERKLNEKTRELRRLRLAQKGDDDA